MHGIEKKENRAKKTHRWKRKSVNDLTKKANFLDNLIGHSDFKKKE